MCGFSPHPLPASRCAVSGAGAHALSGGSPAACYLDMLPPLGTTFRSRSARACRRPSAVTPIRAAALSNRHAGSRSANNPLVTSFLSVAHATSSHPIHASAKQPPRRITQHRRPLVTSFLPVATPIHAATSSHSSSQQALPSTQPPKRALVTLVSLRLSRKTTPQDSVFTTPTAKSCALPPPRAPVAFPAPACCFGTRTSPLRQLGEGAQK